MPRSTLRLGLILPMIVLICAGTARAQPMQGPVEPMAPAPSIPAGVPPVLWVPAAEPANPWEADFVFGLPLGVRFQRSLHPGEGGLAAEGFVGLFLIFPTVGGGLRLQHAPIGDLNDALLLNPGIDAYLLLNPFAGTSGEDFIGGPAAAGVLAVDVDCAWQHRYGEACSGELGFKLGGGIGFSRRVGFIPLVGVFAGLRF